VNNIRQHIKKVLVEEKEDNNVSLVKDLIYDLFDEVSYIEQSTYDNKPLLFIYFDSDEPAANIEAWFDELISEKIMDYTGNNIVLCPYWVSKFDFRKKIADIYISSLKLKHDNSENVMKEEKELNERCWKGYTQKGMKTMFGKEYPNCVKIKKKKSVRETIKDMLDEEVTKKYSKPTEKVEQLVYRWLNDYFEGSQMYHNKSWESTHSFEFCNNGKEIMDVILYFHNDENVYDDKRKTEERDFESASITIPKNILIELSSDIPVRVSYLKYIFEEWFDDTYLGEIQKFMGRNDIYISEFDIMNVDAQTCVPPMTKPEDVTEEDMIEYILKTTLYGRDKILKYENEKPGFIEKTYLSKLRQAEIEKVRGND